jgi:hyperosmotically inducible protein
MNSTFNATARRALGGLGLTLGLLAFGGTALADTVSQNVVDARQETQIWTTYALSPHLRASDLKVSVNNGKATLTGKVAEDLQRDLAKQIALGVGGITEVDNKIVVESNWMPPAKSSSRSYGEEFDDASITASVKAKLLWSKHTDGLTMEVDTKQGVVRLTGTAPSASSRDLAGRLARNTNGVIKVDNRLQVQAKPGLAADAKVQVNQAERDVSDGWITTKVKSTYLYSTNVTGANISVETVNGVVTLSGKVDSNAERALAIELANNVRGVKTVHAKRLTI